MNLSLGSYTNPANISQLSPIVQVIDTYQARKGNPDIINSHTLNFGIEQDVAFKKLYLKVAAEHVIHWDPIMEEKYWNEDKTYIINSFNNHKLTHTTYISTTIKLDAIKDWLSFQGNAKYIKVLSNGNTYKHNYDNLAFHLSADLSHWGFNLKWLWHRPYNDFWGETQDSDRSFNILSLDYMVNKQFHVTLLALNPFSSRNYEIQNNFNSLAGYQRKTYSNAAENLFGVQLTWVANWGNKKKNRQNKYIQDSKIDGSGTTAVGK